MSKDAASDDSLRATEERAETQRVLKALVVLPGFADAPQNVRDRVGQLAMDDATSPSAYSAAAAELFEHPAVRRCLTSVQTPGGVARGGSLITMGTSPMPTVVMWGCPVDSCAFQERGNAVRPFDRDRCKIHSSRRLVRIHTP